MAQAVKPWLHRLAPHSLFGADLRPSFSVAGTGEVNSFGEHQIDLETEGEALSSVETFSRYVVCPCSISGTTASITFNYRHTCWNQLLERTRRYWLFSNIHDAGLFAYISSYVPPTLLNDLMGSRFIAELAHMVG